MKTLAIIGLLALCVACETKPAQPTQPADSPASEPAVTVEVALVGTPISGERLKKGRAAIEKFECSRCHAIPEVEQPPMAKDCVGCHLAIIGGTYPGSPEDLTRWKSNIKSLVDTPDLSRVGPRWKRAWLIDFLQNPHDLRPRLRADMPRMPISKDDAEAIADYLMQSEYPEPKKTLDTALATKGKEITNAKGCWTCHNMAGVDGLTASAIPVPVEPKSLGRAMILAPDLSVRRFREDQLVPWLIDPAAIKPNTTMPNLGLTSDEALAVAAFLTFAQITPAEAPKRFERPPPLGRRVGYKEVKEKVIDKVCAHCHLDPARGNGDGGPGNTGGLGFAGQGLDFTRYAAVRQGSKRRKTEVPLSAPSKDGVPRLTAVLIERHNEVNGLDDPAIAGMPLGHPPMTVEEIQLVDAWVVSGLRR